MNVLKLMIKLSLLVLLLQVTGCKKFLDKKSDLKLVIPSTLEDLQALLDNHTKINRNNVIAAEISADDYYLSQADFNSLAENIRRTYLWEKDNLFAISSSDWTNMYENVFTANSVLDNIRRVERVATNQHRWDDISGQALFLRSYALLQAANLWCPAYDGNSATTDLGLPLRLTSDVNENIARSSVAQTYQQIVGDLKKASALLNDIPQHVIRPSKPAALSLLARTYLSMREYDSCLIYAGASLQLKDTLLDFNPPGIPNSAAGFPFNVSSLLYNNPEILYASRMVTTAALGNTRAKIDSFLYQSYQPDDLRKAVFFMANTGININTYGFKGSFEGNANLFDGPTVSETLLMSAECFARKGMPTEAMNDLNRLMVKRWNNAVTYPVITAPNAADALTKVLTERRKELVMRGLRWMDLKRLNKEGAALSLQRLMNAQTYTLPPNDLRYALPIPENVIAISGMTQNPR